MITLEEMTKWDYKTAWEYFTKNALGKYIPETKIYIESLPMVQTIDLRRNKRAKSIISQCITSHTFVLIDGGSANGKTTFANRLAKQFNAEIIDIDMICKECMDKLLASTRNDMEISYIFQKFDELTDQYIFDNLERIVQEKSQLGKPVILVGCYLEIIYRSIIARTLGKYFEKIVSLFCCEETFEQVERFVLNREDDKILYNRERAICMQQYNFATMLVQKQNIRVLGIGMSSSFVINSRVSNRFK